MELDRKLRVLDQTLSMHTTLRDRYTRRALIVDSLLIACAVVFCASAFATDAALARFGATPEHVRFFLRASSVLAFMLSIISLRIDWKGQSANHGDAAAKMSRALAVFRNNRDEDGAWKQGCAAELDSAYWEAMNNSAPIPSNTFVKLKASHLRKLELSKMLDSNPGCPVFWLRLSLLSSSLRRSVRKTE